MRGKEGDNTYVTAESKAKIAKYASEHEITASVRYFKQTGHNFCQHHSNQYVAPHADYSNQIWLVHILVKVSCYSENIIYENFSPTKIRV